MKLNYFLIKNYKIFLISLFINSFFQYVNGEELFYASFSNNSFNGKDKFEELHDTIAKINFTSSGYSEPGWVDVKGSSSFPINAGNGITLSIYGSKLSSGSDGEPLTILPANVGETYNYLGGGNNKPIIITLSGLNPQSIYSFLIFSSKDDASGESNQTTAFSISGAGAPHDGELLFIDDIYNYDGTLNGFKFWELSEIANVPASLKAPYDYEAGEIYQRYEILSQPTGLAANLQFGFWQDRVDERCQRESVSSRYTVNGPGSVVTAHSSPSTWWELDNGKPLDFSRTGDFCKMGVPLWSDEHKLVSYSTSNSDWGKAPFYHPMTVHATIVGVPEGGIFSGWDYWGGENAYINPVGNTDSMLVIPGVTPDSSGKLKITMSRISGQQGYINALVIVKGDITSSFPENGKPANITCYPNPVKDKINIFNIPKQHKVMVYTLQGEEIYYQSKIHNMDTKIDMKDFSPGVYILKIFSSESNFQRTFKIIKLNN